MTPQPADTPAELAVNSHPAAAHTVPPLGARVRRATGTMLPGHEMKTAIIIGIVTTLYAVLLGWWAQPLRGARVVVSADLHTERVSFRVIDPAKAAFYVEGMKSGRLGAEPAGGCATGLFTPAKNAVVTYGRRGEGDVEVTVAPDPDAATPALAGHFEAQGTGNTMPLQQTWFMTTDAGCKRPAALQFPIWGDASVGLEFRPPNSAEAPPPSVLIDGTIQVAARSAMRDVLYTVASISIPTGARLQAYAGPERGPAAGPQTPGRPAAPSAIWWGTAYVDPQRTALVVALATEAPDIALYRPNQTDADHIGASSLVQLTGDPDIVRMHILALVFVALIGLCDWIGRHWHYWSLRNSERDARDA